MMLALSNPYPLMILGALAVAAYMFAALFYPPLRFMLNLPGALGEQLAELNDLERIDLEAQSR